MFLAVDIGNSRASFGVFENHKLHKVFHVSTPELASKDDLKASLESLLNDNIDQISGGWKAALSSVVPSLTSAFISTIEAKLDARPIVLTAKSQIGFNLRYNTEQLGSDRLANVIGARKLYGFPAIVIDMGTATKYDVLDHKGDYIGGVIAPGVGASAESLFAKAAQLFPVNLEKPARFIANNTSDALKAGIYYGFLGQLEYLIDKIIQDLEYPHIRIVATGGYSEIFAPQMPRIETVDPSLTLKGLEVFSNQ